MTTGPQDPAAAGRDRLRASHADREQVIDTLKTAFVHGRLTRDELDVRAGRALAARTHADLAALTADIPPGPAATGPRRPPAPPPLHLQSISYHHPPIPLSHPPLVLLMLPSPASLLCPFPPPQAPARRGRAERPSKPNRAAAPAMVRFPPAPAPTRPAPTCGLTSHGSTGSTLPPGRAGHPVA